MRLVVLAGCGGAGDVVPTATLDEVPLVGLEIAALPSGVRGCRVETNGVCVDESLRVLVKPRVGGWLLHRCDTFSHAGCCTAATLPAPCTPLHSHVQDGGHADRRRSRRPQDDRVLADRQVSGTAYLFPSPRKPRRHTSKDRVRWWLLYAEELAGVEKPQGSLWHAYRRKWATERKHLPDTDVMRAGGRSNIESLKTAYQHADPKTMLQVMTEPIPLREAESA